MKKVRERDRTYDDSGVPESRRRIRQTLRDRKVAVELAEEEEEESAVVAIEQKSAGSRAITTRRARNGPPMMRKNQEISAKRQAGTRFRACRALLWDREQILLETGWSLQWYLAVEKFVADEDRRIWSETDARNVFAAYRDQQLQNAKELDDLGQIFRNSKQYSALVSALRTRSDILDRIVKTGQDLGVIHKTAKQVEVTGTVDITQLSVSELRVHVQQQVSELNDLLVPTDSIDGAAGAVMKRLKSNFSGSDGRTKRKPRVKVVAADAVDRF